MLDRKSQSWFYPKPTGDVGRDRNARTLQFACLLFAFAIALIVVLNVIEQKREETPVLVLAVAALILAAVMNHRGRWAFAVRTAFLTMLLTACLLVFEAHDGFRSHAMLDFPGLLLISLMFLDRVSYWTTASIALVAEAALGTAEKNGFTRAIPGVRTPTSYESIFDVDLQLLVFAAIGSRIVRDAQSNVFDLHATIEGLSKANLELRESADALRQSEQQQVSIYNTVRDVIFDLAVEPEGDFRFVSVNAAFLKVTGLSQEMVIGKTVNEVIPEPSLTMVLDKCRKAIEERTTVIWEETSDCPNGRLTGEVSVAPVFDDKGTCTHLVGSFHDMTERTRSAEALRRSEEKFATLFRCSPVSVTVSDLSDGGRFLEVNEAFENDTGYSRETGIGRNHPSEWLWADLQEHAQAMAQFTENGKIRDLEFRFRRESGEIRTGILSAESVQVNDNPCVLTTTIDITERKQAEAALRQSEARLTLAQNAAHLGVWDRDMRKNVINIGGHYALLHGLSPDRSTVTQEEWLSLIHPEDRERVDMLRRQAREKTHAFGAEYRVVWPEGSMHWLQAKGTVLVDDSGRPSRSMGVILERYRAEGGRS